MSGEGRAAPVALATLVGALAAFAVSPVLMFFDAEWLAWMLVPVFAVAGTILSVLYLRAADKT
jgi:hypothetical protein